MIESAAKFINLGFFFIPGQIGAAEGTYAWVAQAIGYSAASGFAIALARRLRTLLVAGATMLLFPLRKEMLA